MTEQSPVVPSVGAVPVEVPEDVVRAGAFTVYDAPVAALGVARAVLDEAYPLIAARVRAEADARVAEIEQLWHSTLEQAIQDRDEAEEWADRLAAALACSDECSPILSYGPKNGNGSKPN